MLKLLFKNSGIYLISSQFPKLLSIFLLPVFTKYLTAEDYGYFGTITAYLMFFSAFKDLGFSILFANSFYKYPLRWPFIWRLLNTHLILWSIIYVSLLYLYLHFIIPEGLKLLFLPIFFCIAVPVLFFDNTNMMGSFYFRLKSQPKQIARISILVSFFTVVSNFIGIVYLKLGFMSWFYSSFLGSLITFFYYFKKVNVDLRLYPFFNFKKRFFFRSLKTALPMIPDNYSSYLLNSSDRVVLDKCDVPVNQIGEYNIAYTFGNYFESLGEAIGMAVSPYYTKLFVINDDKSIKTAFELTHILMVVFLTSAFVSALWLKEVFCFFINNFELRKSYGLGIVILMGYTYRPLYWNIALRLCAQEKTKEIWKLSFVAGFLNILLNIVFVPTWGIYAAAFSTFVSLMYIGFSGYYYGFFKLNHLKISSINIYLLSIVFLTVLAFLMKDSSMLLKLFISMCALGSSSFFILSRSKNLQLV